MQPSFLHLEELQHQCAQNTRAVPHARSAFLSAVPQAAEGRALVRPGRDVPPNKTSTAERTSGYDRGVCCMTLRVAFLPEKNSYLSGNITKNHQIRYFLLPSRTVLLSGNCGFSLSWSSIEGDFSKHRYGTVISTKMYVLTCTHKCRTLTNLKHYRFTSFKQWVEKILLLGGGMPNFYDTQELNH